MAPKKRNDMGLRDSVIAAKATIDAMRTKVALILANLDKMQKIHNKPPKDIVYQFVLTDGHKLEVSASTMPHTINLLPDAIEKATEGLIQNNIRLREEISELAKTLI